MQAVTFDEFQGPIVLNNKFPIPELKPNQLLVKVAYCALNPIDLKRHQGYLKDSLFKQDKSPYQVGYDLSGVVEKSTRTLAEYCVVEEASAAIIPESIDFLQAAAIPLAGLTALQALRDSCQLKPGMDVLISGGAGGVGCFAVQLAKRVFSANRVVTTCSQVKLDMCHKLGADVCLDYTKADFTYRAGGELFDCVFDTVGAASQIQKEELVKPGKKIVTIAAAANDEVVFCLVKYNAKDLQDLLAYVDEGKVSVVVDSVFEGLDKFQLAMDRLATGRATGKVVIKV